MLISGGVPVQQVANAVLQQQGGSDGQLEGVFIPILIGAGSLILGGGGLWHLHERHTEKEAYQDCLDKYTSPPFNSSPQEAALVCAGAVQPKGFKFGLNAPTFILVAGSVFGLWFLSQLLLDAARR